MSVKCRVVRNKCQSFEISSVWWNSMAWHGISYGIKHWHKIEGIYWITQSSFPTWFSDNENCTTNMLHGRTKEVI